MTDSSSDMALTNLSKNLSCGIVAAGIGVLIILPFDLFELNQDILTGDIVLENAIIHLILSTITEPL